ncbi:MAG: hypothetical protein V1827_04900 [Candidatus Micrarchaeota archaeon]
MPLNRAALALFIAPLLILSGCSQQAESDTAPITGGAAPQAERTVPHEGKWGIYELELASEDVRLVYSTDDEIQASALRLDGDGTMLVFSQKADGGGDEESEIYSIMTDGGGPKRLTDNGFWDIYPVWSPDGKRIAFLSKRDGDLDLYVMDADGGNQALLYDSGDNDADIDWAGDSVAFTSGFRIWTINDDGTSPVQVTNPADAGRWGVANLPIGDYDPRFSFDGEKIAFERLEDPETAHGSYNLFVVDADGTGEARLTDNGHAQGLASWSHSGSKLVYVVAAIGNEGKYDIHMINADGSGNRDITPGYFPPGFLCHSPIFSKDDSRILFIGQWWE